MIAGGWPFYCWLFASQSRCQGPGWLREGDIFSLTFRLSVALSRARVIAGGWPFIAEFSPLSRVVKGQSDCGRVTFSRWPFASQSRCQGPEWLREGDLLSFSVALPGSRVIAHWPSLPAKLAGKVIGIEQNKFYVEYDDGDKHHNTANQMRILKPPLYFGKTRTPTPSCPVVATVWGLEWTANLSRTRPWKQTTARCEWNSVCGFV